MTTPSEATEVYCVKCKAKTGSKDIEAVTMKNGRPATRSICTECGTRKFRIGVPSDAPTISDRPPPTTSSSAPFSTATPGRTLLSINSTSPNPTLRLCAFHPGF